MTDEIRLEEQKADDGTFGLVSVGLAQLGQLEMEMVGIPKWMLQYAAKAMMEIVHYTAYTKRVEIGERVGIKGDHAHLIARLIASPSAPKQGFARWFGGGRPTRTRIVEPMDTMAPLRTILSTVMIWCAQMLIDEGKTAEATVLLTEAIKFFPGDPTNSVSPPIKVPYNWENHCAYALLGTLQVQSDSAAAVANFRLAAARNVRLAVDMLTFLTSARS